MFPRRRDVTGPSWLRLDLIMSFLTRQATSSCRLLRHRRNNYCVTDAIDGKTTLLTLILQLVLIVGLVNQNRFIVRGLSWCTSGNFSRVDTARHLSSRFHFTFLSLCVILTPTNVLSCLV